MFGYRSLRKRAAEGGWPRPAPGSSPPRAWAAPRSQAPPPSQLSNRLPPAAPFPRPAPLEDRVEHLDRVVAGISTYLDGDCVSAARLVNPMLVVWEAARAVHPQVARPVEEMLTNLLHRNTIGVGEIRVATADVRARALQYLVLQRGALTG